MRASQLAWLCGVFAALAFALGFGVRGCMHMDPERPPTGPTVVSLWKGGERVAREVTHDDPARALSEGCSGCVRVVERIVDSGPMPSNHPELVSISLAAGRDGLSARLGERTVYLTPTDLLNAQVSRGDKRFGVLQLRIGADSPARLPAMLARELDTSVERVLAQGELRRFISRATTALPGPGWPGKTSAADLTVPLLHNSIAAAAACLARFQQRDGSFLYEISATSGAVTEGYSWPRHAGATLFLAEAAHLTGQASLREAAVLAAHKLREVRGRCGEQRCVGEGRRVDVGSSALALLAFHELVATGLDPDFRKDLAGLAAFLLSQQRPDGEFMHFYDRRRRRPIDEQVPYYSGEAALALARAGRLLGEESYVEAADRALTRLVARSFDAFGNRYFFGAEHWTCQTLEALWPVAPNRAALDFCLDYQRFNRRVQFVDSELGRYDGGYGPNPFFPPRLTSASSRSEAGVATLTTAVLAGVDADEIARLDDQVRRALAFIIRHQFLPGPVHLMPEPLRLLGGIPGSPTDLGVRIDYPQHAGSAMLRYLRYLEQKAGGGH